MATVKETEQNLVALCAALLGLETDKTIFRGELPADAVNCVAVGLTGGGNENTPGMERYAVQLLGRYGTRDAAVEMCGKFNAQFPHVGDGFYILKLGKPGVYPNTQKGKNTFGVSVNLDVRLTK